VFVLAKMKRFSIIGALDLDRDKRRLGNNG
jgi:hypothetical protein